MRYVTAMSGGVDSSVAAALLKEAGHEVIGVTLQLYDHGAASGRRGSCCAGQDIHDARRVADQLGIPHYVIDAQARFRETVIENFADGYAAGRTPVPCVRCNMGVKFTDLLALARDLNADALATGHYARRTEGANGAELHRAADLARDQSWFLFATTADQLAYARFPLGDMPDKAEVRAHATRLGLNVAEKPDSQDLCFVPTGSYADLVGKLRPQAAEPGDIVNAEGEVLGRHRGIAHYTVGQRKRLGLPNSDQVVLSLDAKTRRIVVGPGAGTTTEIHLREVNWLDPAQTPFRADVKLRAHDSFRPATITRRPQSEATVELDEPALPAPGQACVFYDGSRVLGGGFIA